MELILLNLQFQIKELNKTLNIVIQTFLKSKHLK